MSRELSFLLANIATFIGLIPSILALFRMKSPSQDHRLLSILVWGGTGISILAFILGAFYLQNLYLLHLFTVFNFVVVTLIFRSFLHRYILYFLLLGFCVFAAINSIWVDQLQSLNVLNRSVSAFIIMVYPMIFFIRTIQEMKVEYLEALPLFWISIGTLFYNASSFFIFLFSKDIVPFEELWHTYFGIHSIFTVLLYIFYTIALWVQPKT